MPLLLWRNTLFSATISSIARLRGASSGFPGFFGAEGGSGFANTPGSPLAGPHVYNSTPSGCVYLLGPKRKPKKVQKRSLKR